MLSSNKLESFLVETNLKTRRLVLMNNKLERFSLENVFI
jgi:hypothetical protein